jgi:hypothetical protein
MNQYLHKPIDQANETVVVSYREILRARELRSLARQIRETTQQLRAQLQRRQGEQSQQLTSAG